MYRSISQWKYAIKLGLVIAFSSWGCGSDSPQDQGHDTAITDGGHPIPDATAGADGSQLYDAPSTEYLEVDVNDPEGVTKIWLTAFA